MKNIFTIIYDSITINLKTIPIFVIDFKNLICCSINEYQPPTYLKK